MPRGSLRGEDLEAERSWGDFLGEREKNQREYTVEITESFIKPLLGEQWDSERFTHCVQIICKLQLGAIRRHREKTQQDFLRVLWAL